MKKTQLTQFVITLDEIVKQFKIPVKGKYYHMMTIGSFPESIIIRLQPKTRVSKQTTENVKK